MTVTRQSLRFKCSVKDCPWRDDEDIHVPWCLGIPDVEHWADKPTHQHWPKKGMGGKNPKSKIVAILCVTCHDRIDNGTDWGNAVVTTFEDGQRIEVYRAWDLHNETLIERIISVGRLSDGAEGEQSEESVIGPSAAAPSAGSKEESDEEDGDRVRSREGLSEGKARGDTSSESRADIRVGPHGGGRRRVDSHGDHANHSVLTHEQRVAIAQEIRDAQLQRQWRAGDVANAWEEELNEEFWNLYANEFGYTYPSLQNVMRVCKKIPRERRHDEVSFAHHNVMVGFDIETRDAWLERAHDEDWPVKRLREELAEEGLLTAKPKVKRWSRPELQERWDGFWAVHEQENPEWDFGSLVKVAFAKFLDWLSAEEQG